jgi:hypothetical protein
LPTVNFGASKKVYLSILDDRPNNLAAEFSAPHHPTIAIQSLVTSEPIAVVLEKNVGEGLRSMGFELIPARSASETWLKINVLSFYVVSRPGLDNWTGNLRVKLQLYKNETQVLDKEYDGLKDFSNPFPPYAGIGSLMAANINPIVSDIILKILSDLELIAALQSPET